MQWESRYELGHAEMDAMHREFVDLVNDLAAADKDTLGAVLARIHAHSVAHFAAEERWMQESAFAMARSHAGEHLRLLKSLESAQRMLAKGMAAPARALANELPGWFVDHSVKMDAALAGHLRQ
jgi:hemerythrin